MALNIFILEDDFFHQARIEKAIFKAVKESEVRYKKMETYENPSQLLDSITETGNHQLFFLDIEIQDAKKKGMEIAREIREKDPNAIIIFVTTHSEFMPLTYKYRVSALDFIDKGLTEGEFNESIQDILEYAYQNISKTVSEDSFVFKSKHSHVQVPFSDILYFETSTIVHKVVLITKTGSLEFYGKVSDIAKSDSRLYQSHRSIVVNPDNIVRVDRANHTVHFQGEETCLVSRLKIKGLIERISGNA